jgi:anti-sigma factor RsiW
VLDGEFSVTGDDELHLGSCLACQSELARYRRLARLLTQLRAERIEMPPGLVRDVLAGIERVALVRAGRRTPGRVAVISGGVGASALLAALIVARRVARAPHREPAESATLSSGG